MWADLNFKPPQPSTQPGTQPSKGQVKGLQEREEKYVIKICVRIHHLTMIPDFEFQFNLNTMDPNKADETVYMVDPPSQPVLDVFNSILSKMGVDVSIHTIGYRLSDQKESVWSRISNIDDFSHAIELQRDIQSRAFKSKRLRIINKVSNNTT